MAGAVGIEPTNHGIKTRCLTAWLRPNSYRSFNPVAVMFASSLYIFVIKSLLKFTNNNFTKSRQYEEISNIFFGGKL